MASSSTSVPPEPQSFTTMDKDVEAIGSHCQYTFCNQLDFLPFRCESCKGYSQSIPSLLIESANKLHQYVLPRPPHRNRPQMRSRRRLGRRSTKTDQQLQHIEHLKQQTDPPNRNTMLAPTMQNLHQHPYQRRRELPKLQPPILPQTPPPRGPRLLQTRTPRRADRCREIRRPGADGEGAGGVRAPACLGQGKADGCAAEAEAYEWCGEDGGVESVEEDGEGG